MKSILFIPILVCLCTWNLKSQNFNPLLAKMLEDTLKTYSSQISNIKGISASVSIPAQGTWQGQYGDSYSGKSITKDMLFGIASNTKLFVSAIMLMLTEHNIIHLNDSIKRWLPTYRNVNPNITIRQLLNHTSGISDPIFISPLVDTIMKYPQRIFTPNEVLSYLGAPMFLPGQGWSYSNVNYILAGMIAQSATGYHISRLIRDSILTPLHLNNTFYDVEEPEKGTIAHRWWNGVDYNNTSRVALNTAGGSAGALFSTAADMTEWYAALFQGKLLNVNSLKELTSFVSTPSLTYFYGLGLALETTLGLTYYTHGGDTWGYKSKMIHDSCLGTNVCVLSNAFPSGIPGITFLLYRVVKNHIPGCSAAIKGLDSVCAGTPSVQYSVPPIDKATSYSWTLPSGVNGKSNTNIISVDFDSNAVSGNITVTGINNYGPGGSSSIYIKVNPKPVTPVVTQNGNVLTSSSNIGNQWYNSFGIIPGENKKQYSITKSDRYYCIVTLLGCSSNSSNVIEGIYTGLSKSEEPHRFLLSPNPATSYTTISTSFELKKATINIYNSTGQLIRQLKNFSGQSVILDCDHLDQGFYFIQLEMNNKLIDERKMLIIP